MKLTPIAYVDDRPVSWIPEQEQHCDVNGKLIPLLIVEGILMDTCGELVKCYDNVRRPCVRKPQHTGGCNPFSDTDHSKDSEKVRVVSPPIPFVSGFTVVPMPKQDADDEQVWGKAPNAK